ncbi:MAG: ABC transporter ATP-binding protein [Myxococcaceae bacterium]|nr:ABC transporter ATP-binding protein [Myxococcaceae bacterium]
MIQVDGLTKYYGDHAAIRNLSFRIERGEVIGFLGLNGAGKTTTLKVLGCVLLPTSGRVTIDGFDVVENPHEIRKRIGFLPDTPPLYDEMTVSGYLSFVARLRRVPFADVRARVDEALQLTALVEVRDELVGALSHGYRQRVGVAQALVHRPELLILDEPSGGLDPVQIVEMRGLIKKLKGRHTVLVSSHILPEISQICDRLLVIQEGEIVAQGTEAELAARLGAGGSIEVEVLGAAARALEAVRAIPAVQDAVVLREQDGVVALRLDAPAELRPEVARALVNAGVDLLRIDRGTQKLESIFLKLTQDRTTKEAA